jgi:cystathionine gamma-synthase
MPPVHLSVNYEFEGIGRKRQYDYSRTANPTRDELAQALARAEGGAGGVVTSTGMSAILLLLHLVRPGELVVAPHDGYGGTFRLLSSYARERGLLVEFVDLNDVAARDAAFRRGPRIVWIETPSNPLLRIVDIRETARAAHAAGAEVVADNTFLSPALQQPLSLGADYVVHSTTKYINGHGDVVGGAVVACDAARHERLAWWANCIGVAGAPFDSYLTLRGLRTLHARMALHERNALRIAQFLESHPCVGRVHYPGVPSHPGHAVAKTQQKGFGGMLSFELAGGQDVGPFVDRLECFSLAESLGGVESLIAHPATMTHASMDPAARRRAGIGDALLRLSVGIEDADDLVADLDAALRATQRPRTRCSAATG